MDDWYEMAAVYFQSTKRALRMIAFEQEIPGFWLTKAGHRYFAINQRLLARGVDVRRIYAIDFALATQAPEIFATMVAYIQQQASAGIKCRAMDRAAFSETLRLNCALFGVQDSDNVAMFSLDGTWVTIVRERELVRDAVEIYDDLFSSKESISPSSLRRSR